MGGDQQAVVSREEGGCVHERTQSESGGSITENRMGGGRPRHSDVVAEAALREFSKGARECACVVASAIESSAATQME
jgi:hypothetical protein